VDWFFAAEHAGRPHRGAGSGGGHLAHSAVENVTNIVLDPFSRRAAQALTTFMSSATGASPSSAGRAPSRIPSSAGRRFRQVAREMASSLDPALVAGIDSAGWVDEDRIPPDGPGNRPQADAGAFGEEPRLHAIFLLQRHRRHRAPIPRSARTRSLGPGMSRWSASTTSSRPLHHAVR